jgi:beta-N-acetylhexosaminidase
MFARARTTALLLLAFTLLAQGCALMRPEQPTPELKRLAGQMLLVGFRGAEPSDENGQPLPILSQVAELNLGGVILFDRDAALGIPDRNIKSPEQVQRLTSALSLAATNAGLPPLFIAVDQEGGRVQRLKPANGFPDSPAAAELCPEAPQAQSAADSAPALTAGAATGRMLREAGFNLDFAPVCDVNVNPDNPVIGKIGRSFSADPKQAAACAGAFAQGLQGQGVLTAAKHFPGHGSSTSDSHLGFTDVSATWTEAELQPFVELIRAGLADMVMTAHVFNTRLDTKHPATLSRPVITGLLRKKLSYTGVVVTDDLQMRAVASRYGFKEALGLAVNAGADILLIGNNLEYDENIAPKALDLLMELVAEGVVCPERIRESAGRVQALKAQRLRPPALNASPEH